MKTCALPLLATLSALALAACDSGTSEPTDAATTAPEATTAALPLPEDTALVSPVSSTVTIPAALQGRWGMVAADCEPGRADAKGLLVIDGTRLEFYESVGTLGEIEEAGETRLRADFDFTGEGMTWDRDVLLEAQDGGETLIRREYGVDAAPDPFRYSKCA